jgi:AcrR family transcriptional regulator
MTHHTDVRERLIEAACHLFHRDGFEGTSVREITRRAKANLGAITYHFGTKEALYHAVIERFGNPFADRLAEIAAEPAPPRERIARVIREFMRRMTEHPEMPSLMVREMAADRPLPAPIARIIRRNIESVGRIITEGQREGTIRAGEPQLLALSVAAQPLFLAMAQRGVLHALGSNPQDPALRERIADHIVTTVTAGLSAPGAPPYTPTVTETGAHLQGS